jgi:spermidine synthase
MSAKSGVTHEKAAPEVATANPGATAGLKSKLHATVAFTGAAVMVVEIAGTRLIGPSFGVSLFVWSALIAVTLSSLAVGYYLGGAVVDRRPAPTLLGYVIGASAIALAVAALLDRPIISLALALGPRFGPLLSAALLFAPSLVGLGMIGPISVRLATVDIRETGHGVGRIYAISTAGSLIGTLLVSFYIIPAFETKVILLSTAALLAVCSVLWLPNRWRVGALAVAVASLSATVVGRSADRALPSQLHIVARAHSPYGLLEVIDDTERNARVLRADHSIIGGHHFEDHSRIFNYVSYLECLRFLRPEAKRMLQLGLGAGTLARSVQAHGITVDAVELDPQVVSFAEQYFDYSPNGTVYVEDARAFINRSDQKYDLIVHDTFTGGATPDHLLSLEVLQRLRGMLEPDGIVALNFIGFDSGPNAEATWAIARTVREVFPVVRLFREAAERTDPPSLSNMLFFASDAPLDFDISIEEVTLGRQFLRRFISHEIREDIPPGPIVTDAQNALSRMQVPIAEAHFAAMNQLMPTGVWLP